MEKKNTRNKRKTRAKSIRNNGPDFLGTNRKDITNTEKKNKIKLKRTGSTQKNL